MLENKAAEGKHDVSRLRRASVPERASRHLADTLFDKRALFVTEELRSYARTAYHNLLVNLAERFRQELNGRGADIRTDDVIAAFLDTPVDVSPDLASALYHRSEEARLSKRLRSLSASAFLVGDSEDPETLASAWGREDRQLAARLDAYIRLRAPRSSEETGPTLSLDELGEHLSEALVWRLAGRLAATLANVNGADDETGSGAEAPDLPSFERAAGTIAGEVDIVRSVQHAAMMLAARIAERGHLGDWLVMKALLSGDVLLAVSLVAVRARLSSGTAWLLLIRNMRTSAATLLRAAGFEDPAARQILQLLYQASGEEADADAARAAADDDYAAVDRQAAQDMLAFWRLDPRLRSGLEQN